MIDARLEQVEIPKAVMALAAKLKMSLRPRYIRVDGKVSLRGPCI